MASKWILFHSITGGERASVSMAKIGWELASQGRRVCLLDLDLEHRLVRDLCAPVLKGARCQTLDDLDVYTAPAPEEMEDIDGAFYLASPSGVGGPFDPVVSLQGVRPRKVTDTLEEYQSVLRGFEDRKLDYILMVADCRLFEPATTLADAIILSVSPSPTLISRVGDWLSKSGGNGPPVEFVLLDPFLVPRSGTVDLGELSESEQYLSAEKKLTAGTHPFEGELFPIPVPRHALFQELFLLDPEKDDPALEVYKHAADRIVATNESDFLTQIEKAKGTKDTSELLRKLEGMAQQFEHKPQFLRELTDAHLALDRPRRALKSLKEHASALGAQGKRNPYVLQVHAWALVELARKDATGAKENLRDAQKLLEESKTRLNSPEGNMQLADVCVMLAHADRSTAQRFFRMALDCLEESLAVLEEQSNRRDELAACLYRLGYVYSQLAPRARGADRDEYVNRAIDSFEKAIDKRRDRDTYMALGRELMQKGVRLKGGDAMNTLEVARERLEQADRMTRRPDFEAAYWRGICLIELSCLQDFENALRSLEDASRVLNNALTIEQASVEASFYCGVATFFAWQLHQQRSRKLHSVDEGDLLQEQAHPTDLVFERDVFYRMEQAIAAQETNEDAYFDKSEIDEAVEALELFVQALEEQLKFKVRRFPGWYRQLQKHFRQHKELANSPAELESFKELIQDVADRTAATS